WASHWTHNEFNFKSDVQDYHTSLSEEERGVIKRAILLISQVEVAVKSYWSNIGKHLPKPEIADMGAVFGGVEVIHSRAYSEILSKLGLEDEFITLLDNKPVMNRVTYLNKYVDRVYKDDKKQFLYSLILFTLFTENVSLFSQFYTILGFNRFNAVLKDTANVVQYTSKEENLHAEGGMALINQIRREHPELFDEELEKRIIEEAHVALAAESGLIDWILQGFENQFLSYDILNNYLKSRVNESLSRIGFDFKFPVVKSVVDVTEWMDEEVFASALSDFFHKKPIDYAKSTKSFTAEELF
ncbi:ribonucleotide reductase, partial [bacterium]|nr:ribonucleotide reductase [bacterium]